MPGYNVSKKIVIKIYKNSETYSRVIFTAFYRWKQNRTELHSSWTLCMLKFSKTLHQGTARRLQVKVMDEEWNSNKFLVYQNIERFRIPELLSPFNVEISTQECF